MRYFADIVTSRYLLKRWSRYLHRHPDARNREGSRYGRLEPLLVEHGHLGGERLAPGRLGRLAEPGEDDRDAGQLAVAGEAAEALDDLGRVGGDQAVSVEDHRLGADPDRRQEQPAEGGLEHAAIRLTDEQRGRDLGVEEDHGRASLEAVAVAHLARLAA